MAANPNGNNPAAFDSAASRTQWLKGVLEICLLGMIGGGEAYGYEIGQKLKAAGLGEVKGGTLYPRLTALEKAGLLEVEWRQGESGPGRKYYRLTPAGASFRDAASSEYRRFNNVVDGVLPLNEAETK